MTAKAMRVGLVALLAAACCAGAACAGPLQPGEILVVDSGLEDVADGAVFRVDPVTGERTILAGRGIGAGPELYDPLGITLDANRQIYITDRVVSQSGTASAIVYRVDPVTGQREEISGPNIGTGVSLGERSRRITVSGTGHLLVAGEQPELAGPLEDGAVFDIDPLTGDRSVLTGPTVGSGPFLEGPVGILLDLSGNLISVDHALTSVDLTTGNRHNIRPSGSFLGGTDAAVQDEFSIFVADFLSAKIYRVDRASGFQHIISGQTLFDGLRGDGPLVWPYSIEFENESQLVGYGGIGEEQPVAGVFRVNVETGDRTVLSGAGVGSGAEFIRLGSIALVPVPEPSTIVIASMGIVILVTAHLSRRKR